MFRPLLMGPRVLLSSMLLMRLMFRQSLLL
jgi:hypothetical protein